jgi:hypothetical protein
VQKAQLCHVCLSVRPSVSMEQLGFHCMDFHGNWYWSIFRKSVKKIHLSLKFDKNNGYVKANIHFRSYLAHFFFEWEMLQTECVDKIRWHSLRTLTFENCTLYEIMWKNIVQAGRLQMTVWHMRIVRWMHKASNAHSEYVMLIAFPLKQWLHERVSMSHVIHCLSCFKCQQKRTFVWNIVTEQANF